MDCRYQGIVWFLILHFCRFRHLDSRLNTLKNCKSSARLLIHSTFPFTATFNGNWHIRCLIVQISPNTSWEGWRWRMGLRIEALPEWQACRCNEGYRCCLMVAGTLFPIFILISDTNLDTEPCPALSDPFTDCPQHSSMPGIISPLWMALLSKQADSSWSRGFAWCETIWRIANYEICMAQ